MIPNFQTNMLRNFSDVMRFITAPWMNRDHVEALIELKIYKFWCYLPDRAMQKMETENTMKRATGVMKITVVITPSLKSKLSRTFVFKDPGCSYIWSIIITLTTTEKKQWRSKLPCSETFSPDTTANFLPLSRLACQSAPP